MEPDPLTAANEDNRLAALLRAQATPLADDGFSARVLAALPPPSAAPRTVAGRSVLVSVGALLGLGVASLALLNAPESIVATPWSAGWAQAHALATPLTEPALTWLGSPMNQAALLLALASLGLSFLLIQRRSIIGLRWLF